MIDQMQEQHSQVLTPRQAATIIGCTPGNVRLMIKSGEIRATKEPSLNCRHGYEWLIPRREAERIRDNPHALGRPRGSKNKEMNDVRAGTTGGRKAVVTKQ